MFCLCGVGQLKDLPGLCLEPIVIMTQKKKKVKQDSEKERKHDFVYIPEVSPLRQIFKRPPSFTGRSGNL